MCEMPNNYAYLHALPFFYYQNLKRPQYILDQVLVELYNIEFFSRVFPQDPSTKFQSILIKLNIIFSYLSHDSFAAKTYDSLHTYLTESFPNLHMIEILQYQVLLWAVLAYKNMNLTCAAKHLCKQIDLLNPTVQQKVLYSFFRAQTLT